MGHMQRPEIVDRVIKAAGGVNAVARAFGIAPASVSGWRSIPPDRVLALEALTGISRYEQRPDVFGVPLRRAAVPRGT